MLNDCLAGAQAELAKATAELELRKRELAGQSERILLLDRVATLLAERVIERQHELRAVRAERADRQLDGGVRRASASGSGQVSPNGSSPGPKPATSASGRAGPIRQAR